jgi:cardiolipin synthase (CMP-forming)
VEKIWNLPNILSLFRILLAIPLGFALWYNENVIAVLIALLSSITDIIDGYFARRLNQSTEFGKIIDPLADKVTFGTIVIVLIIQQRIPLWFALIILGRDLLILLGGLWASKKIKSVLPSNLFGKITTIVLMLTLLLIILGINSIVYYAIWASTLCLAVSFFYYAVRTLIVVKKFKHNENDFM